MRAGVVLPRRRHAATGAPIAEEAFDDDRLRAELDARGASAVIAPRAGRARFIRCGFAICRWRHLVESFFCNVEGLRRITTRHDKTDTSDTAAFHLVGACRVTK